MMYNGRFSSVEEQDVLVCVYKAAVQTHFLVLKMVCLPRAFGAYSYPDSDSSRRPGKQSTFNETRPRCHA